MNYKSEQLFPADEVIEKVRVNNLIQIWVVAFIRFFICWCLLSGIIILIFRILYLKAPFLYLFLSGIPLALIYGLDFAYKHQVSKDVCVASVDAYNKAGGLLISEFETGDKSWRFARKSLFAIPQNRVPYNYQQLCGILLIALIFVFGSYYIPLFNINKLDSRKINLSKKVSEIKDQIELLQEEEVITQDEKLKLESALEDIVNNSDKESPGITFEALDQMSEKLRYEASDEMKKRIKDVEVLKKLENFAKESKKAAGDSKKIQEELEKLKKQLRQLGLSENEINDLLNEQFGESGASNGISNQNMGNISQTLNNSIQKKMIDTSELAEKMMDKKLIDEATSDKLKQSMESKSSDKAEMNNNSFFSVDDGNEQVNGQKDNNSGNSNSGQESSNSGQDGGESGQEGSVSKQGNGNLGEAGGDSGQEGSNSGQEGGESGVEDGVGGVSRGGGYTPMTFGDKASDYNAKYHDEVLPSVNSESVLGATSLGMGVADPEINQDKEKYTTTVINNSLSSENALNKKNILPKHKNAVKNYFNQ